MIRLAREFQELFRRLIPVEIFDFYDGPRFYSVKDLTGQLYLVYWIDETEQGSSWLYVRISQERYAAVKSGYVSVAEALSTPEDSTAFVREGGALDFQISQLNSDEIMRDWLPEGDYRLDIAEATLPPKKVVAVDLARIVQRQVLDLAFLKLSNTYEMSARKLGRLLESIQGSVEAFACGNESTVRRVPEDIKNHSELMFTQVFASSFGVRLQTKGSDIFGNDDTARALETLANLINALGTSNAITKDVRNFNILARTRFKHLLSVLVDAQVSVAIDWANPDGRTIQAHASFEEISQSLNKLKSLDEATKQIIEHTGRLVGIDVQNNFFAFVDAEAKIIKGELALPLRGEHFKIPSEVTVTIEETCEIDPLTDKEKWMYVLLAVVES